MNLKPVIYRIGIFAAICCFSAKLVAAKEAPLFSKDEPLNITLIADVVALMEDKSQEPEYTDALLMHHHDKYKFDAFDIKVKARGKTRRVTGLCEFPPLKLNFKKDKVKNTIFEHQDKLKFVSQCRQQEEFNHYVLEEYLLYKTYTILSDESYRVRLVNISIRDRQLRVPPIEMVGFLIEDDEQLAKRIGAKPHKEIVFSQDSCVDASIDRMAMFQYMIGNTDWYVNTGHNIDLFQYKSDGALIPVPFDFDFAGVINTTYASPSKEIPIKQVRQRYFKGSCREMDEYRATIRLFNDKKEEIYALYTSFDMLPGTVIKSSLKYYDKFYKIINDVNLVANSFSKECYSSPFQTSLK